MKLNVNAISDELKLFLNQQQDFVVVLESMGASIEMGIEYQIIFANTFCVKNSVFKNQHPNIHLGQAFPDLILSDFLDKLSLIQITGKQLTVEHPIDFLGREFWLKTKVVKLSDYQLLCTSENITSSKIKEQQSAEMNLMLNEAHEILNMNCWELDLQTKVITTNSDFSKIFDFDNKCKSISLETYYSLMLPSLVDDARQFLITQIINRQSFAIEREFITHNGTHKYIEITGKPIYQLEKCKKIIGTFRDITQRKEAETLQINTEEKLSEAMILLKMGSWEFDLSTKKHFYSKELSEILEYDSPINFYSFEEYFSHVDESEKENSLSNYAKVTTRKNNLHVDRKLISKKGNIKYVEFVSKSLESDQTKIFGTFRDITEKKIQELKLLENDKRLNEAHHILKTGTWEYNSTTRSISFSDETYRLINGKIPQNLHIADYFKFVNPELREQYFSIFLDATTKNQSLKSINHLCFEDGSFKFIEIIGNPASYNKSNTKFNGTFRDVTDDFVKDAAIKDSEEKFKLLFESNPTIYFTLDENGFIISINQFGIDYFGYVKEEIVGHHVSKVFYTEDSKKAIKNLELLKYSDNDFLQWEIRKVKKTGEIIWVKETARLAKSRHGKTIYLIVCEDITSEILNRNLIRKKQQELIWAKEKAEEAALEKQQFASIMSHEVRTPLNAVIGMTNILLMDNPRDNQVQELNTLKFAAESLLSLVNDILDFSKIESGKVNLEQITFDLPVMVTNLRNSYQFKADEKNIKINAIIDETIPHQLIGDPTRLAQILNNLVSNAIKFTSKGYVDISIRTLITQGSNTTIRFEISDSGIGIPADKHATIFESFSQANSDTTRKYGGTGLGLTITKKLIELHQSSIFIDSEPGKGSTFYFDLTFEISSEKLLPVPNFEELGEKNIVGKKILLVEDNPFNQLIATKFLEKWSAIVETAENGRIALEILSKTNDFDLILMDIQMPELDGIQTTKAIRKLDDIALQRIPIIALTAVAMENDKEKFLNDGMNDYISKPFNPSELYKKILQFF
jgi:PAS domain S-box-containing protein